MAGRGAGETAFARVFEGDTGLDLYTPAISDAYHDVFGEGIFAGKGIYDVAAFERALAGRVPDNTLLSHDLFEGIHGRAGFISDVQFQEDYPSHVVGYARRLQRWIRGDWQLLPWLGRTVPLADGTRAPNPLSVMGRWKILDNLRRSLTAPTMLALLLVGWVLLPESAWFLTGIAAGTLGAPIVLGAATNANRIVAGAAWRPTVTTAIRSARMDLLRWLLALMLLAFEAAIALSAIGRTLFRLTVTHRQLLEWQPAALTARLVSQLHTARPVWRFMWTSPAIGAGGALLVAVVAPRSLPAALPFLLAWLAAPLVAHQMSRTYVPAVPLLSGDERGRLRRLARRTWYYFEHVLSPDNNWLPPDNIQESPVALVAHRTSPTNVGMGLLATLGAYDLGYLGLRSMTTTVGHTMTGLAGLERFRGHCFNWCDTQTGEVLAPRYISVVDSGNLAAALITLREACLDLDNVPILAPALWRGLRDTLDVFRDIVERLPVVADARRDLLQMVAAWQDQLRTPPPTPAAQRALADALRARELPALEASTADLVEATVGTLDAPSLRALFLWLDRVRYQLERMLMEFDQLAPWAAHVEQAPDAVRETLARWPTLRAAAALPRTLGPLGPETAFGRAITEGAQTARAVRAQLQQVASEAAQLVGDMDFRFLYDRHRRLFHIGYDVDAGRLDTSYYDLLASEARLASLVAIAKRDVPERHWLHLGRPLARASGRGGRVLLSWGGTMFEYLMPTLVAESPEQSLLTLGSRGAVRQQQRFGRRHGIPWGTSESAFHVLSSEGHYQYRAFGVPGLGLKRDLGDRLVVAPYASVLALPLAPGDVARNVEAIERLGGLGDYGLYEALDYGAPPAHDGPPAIVRAYMSHHQGMIMVALTNHLAGGTMVRRFHQDARIASVEYLLFEQSPHAAPLHRPERRPALRVGQPRRARYAAWPVDLAGAPHMHLLSNGRYHVLATSAGGGGSRWRGRALTRWRAESGANQWGHWCYLQDRDSGALWSAAQQPVHDVDTDAGVLFSASRVEYRVRAHDIATRMVVTVPPGDDLEVRRITLQNESGRVRRLTITAYCEIALARPADDLRHQAFSKLFVESEVLPAARTVLFRRRPGGPDPGELFLGQTLAVQGGRPVACSWETDRARFLGPAGPARRPAALIEGMPLGGDGGATVDPVAAFRCEVDVPAGGRVGLAFVTSVATTRAALLDRLEAYRSWSRIERAVEEAAVHADGELNALNVAVDEVRTIQRLFSAMLVPHANLRPTDALAAERGSQAELWRFGISGDKPIVLLRVVSDRDDTVTNVQTALRFRSLLKGRGCEMDLVLVDELSAGYHQPWHERLQALLREVDLQGHTGPVPGVYLLRGRELPPGDRQLLEAAARVVLDTGRSIAEQLTALDRPPGRLPAFAAHVAAPPDTALPPPPPPDLAFDNGAGGFSADGREYVVTLTPTTGPPRAWSHVVANAQFGFLASARGGGYTWSVNSAERRLTPWRNDPVTDAPGEVLYLRDEETGLVWSPAAQPAGRGHTHTARFGAGYVTYEAHHEQLAQTVRMFVAPDDPVKLIEVTLENLSARPRRLTATWYAEWVLGTSRHRTTPHLVPEYDALNGTLLARNPFHPAFAARTAFLTSGLPPHGLTTDRAEFIGERDNYRRPAALHRIGPSGAVRAGGDPCAALQVYVHVEPGERRTIHFAMGDGADRDHALALAKRYCDAGAVREAWSASAERWNHLLGAVQVRTPDPALDVLLNHWLLYQAMASRLWARTGLDQSGGAFGFRDQLQDVLALTHAAPALARAQLLEAARHQFAEGDVLHWWHPGADAGVRTRCSDDLLWLPYAAAHYVAATGDKGVLDEAVPFLVGEPLAKDEGDRYGHFPPSDQPASLYEHCVRALEYGHRPGVHGLPLFGAGDWNDGMNRVGAAGRGESVWLAWFFIATARAFLPLCERRGDGERAVILTRQADVMTRAVEEHAWDGGWYLRGYFDDGTPLGSQAAQECQLDAVAQSWAVISGAADPERARTAMHAVLDRLADKDLKLLRLFDPPFDRARQDPGYIRAYPPGVRENGGQYTHAALWTAWAVGLLGDGDQLGELLRWLNPVHRTSTPEGVAQYRGEPYVVAADISTNPYRPGAAGWTWYTGSASWMYRLGMEVLLGVRREGEMLVVNPCIPRAWDGFDVRWRVGRSVYHITVRNPEHVCRGVARMLVDGVPLDGVRIPLRDDGAAHEVEVVLGGRG
ncbi:MAG: glucoamylase family protein [Gemmatimonadales bacterium]